MKKIKIITVVLFFVLLAIPVITFNWKENVVSEIDNRNLTNNPFGDNYVIDGEMDLSGALEDYVQDRIGLRSEMISAYTLLYDRVFGEMVHPSYMYGKDGYVFAGVSYTEFGEYHIAFADMIKRVQDYCADRNVPFVFMFDPSKATVLRDKLADGINYNNDWVEEFFEALNERGINYVDNTELMIEKTEEGEDVFNQKYDAGHWNDLGAFYGVNSVLEDLKKFFPQIHLNKKSDFDIKEELNTSLPVSRFPIHEYEPLFVPRYELVDLTEEYQDEVQIDPQHRMFLYQINDKEKEAGSPKTLVFQGSYINEMGYKFFANSLGEYIAIHNYQNIINFDYYFNLFQPECVVFEVAEYTVSDSYFDYDNMINMQLNPAFTTFDGLQVVNHSISECTVEITEGEKTWIVAVDELPADTQYAYLQTGEDNVFDLKFDQEDENYKVTLDNSVKLTDLKIVVINNHSSLKEIYE